MSACRGKLDTARVQELQMTKRPPKPVPVAAQGGEMLFYEAEDGRLRLEVRMHDETL